MPSKRRRPIEAHGYIRDGVLTLNQRDRLRAALRTWPDGPVDVEIRQWEERRRILQNDSYWRALDLISEASVEDRHWDKDEWHLYFAQRFNGAVLSDLDPKTGEVVEIRVGKSTAKLGVEAFAEYLEHVLNFAAEQYGLVIEFDPEKRSNRRGRREEAA